MRARFHYFSGDCCDENVQAGVQERFIHMLQEDIRLLESCTLYPEDCRLVIITYEHTS